MERTCKKCGETKPIEEFTKSKDCKFGYAHMCRPCNNILYRRKYASSNRCKALTKLRKENQTDEQVLRRKEYMQNYRKTHTAIRSQCSEYKRDYWIKNKNILSVKSKIWREKNKDKISKYKLENRELILKRAKEYRIKNKDKIRKEYKAYCDKNRDEIRLKGRIKNIDGERRKQRKEDRDYLKTYYISAKLRRSTGLNMKTIKEHPELIESYGQQIKIKRLLKQKKDESTKTS